MINHKIVNIDWPDFRCPKCFSKVTSVNINENKCIACGQSSLNSENKLAGMFYEIKTSIVPLMASTTQMPNMREIKRLLDSGDSARVMLQLRDIAESGAAGSNLPWIVYIIATLMLNITLYDFLEIEQMLGGLAGKSRIRIDRQTLSQVDDSLLQFDLLGGIVAEYIRILNSSCPAFVDKTNDIKMLYDRTLGKTKMTQMTWDLAKRMAIIN